MKPIGKYTVVRESVGHTDKVVRVWAVPESL
jgi:hypothetical protein